MRKHHQQSMRIYGFYSEARKSNLFLYTHWFDPGSAGRLIFPAWKILAEYHHCISISDLTFLQKVTCHLVLIHWIKRNVRYLVSELKTGGQFLYHNRIIRVSRISKPTVLKSTQK
jgi:hypothetical protein